MKKYVRENRISPLLKYPGGKEKELKFILPNLPSNVSSYYEPFIGGGAVYFAMECDKYYINDKSDDLINLYNMVKEQNEDFLNKLSAIDHNWFVIDSIMCNHGNDLMNIYLNYRNKPTNQSILHAEISAFIIDNADEFNGLLTPTFIVAIDDFVGVLIKSIYNKMKRMQKLEKEKGIMPDEDVLKNIECSIKTAFYTHFRFLYNNHKDYKEITKGYLSAIFLFLRQYCYSSMFRFNKQGEFNVPYGGISYNKKGLSSKIIQYTDDELINHLNQTEIYNVDFYEFFSKVKLKNDDFIFLDPPYDTEFSTYDKNEFLKSDQKRLSDFLIDECVANFMLVIKNTEFIKSLYPIGTKTKNGDKIYVKGFDKKYLVSFKDRNEKDVEHLIITNYKI